MIESDLNMYKSTLSFPPKESVRCSSVHSTFIRETPSQPYGAVPRDTPHHRVGWRPGGRPAPCRGRSPNLRSCTGCLGSVEPAEAVTKSLMLSGHTQSSHIKSTACPLIIFSRARNTTRAWLQLRTKCSSQLHLSSTELSTSWTNLDLNFFIRKMGNDYQN